MSDTSKLLKYAINYLSKYSSSKGNLIRVLKNKVGRLKIEKKEKYILYQSIDEIIIKLEKNNFIDDYNYTSTKIRNFAIQGKSKMFIKSYFYQKGVENEIFLETLEKYENKNPQWEVESAKIFARKKRFKNNLENKNKNLSKMARAGFSFEISTRVLNDL